jgi:hypothetical protein
MTFFRLRQNVEAHREAEMSLGDYIEACKKDPLGYAENFESVEKG